MSLDDVRYIVVVAVLLLWFFKRNTDLPWTKTLGVVLVLITLVEFGALLLLQSNVSNHWIYNLFTLFNVLASMVLISQIGKMSRMIPYGALTIVGLFMIYHVLFGPGFMVLDGGTAIIAGFLLAGFSAFGLYRLAEDAEDALLSKAEFWILSAYLVYYLCFSPIIGLVTYIVGESRELAVTLLQVNEILFILHFLMIGYAVIIASRTRVKPISNG